MDEILVRQYRIEDRNFVRSIACDTAFMGKPAEMFFDDRQILADILTLYYTDYEPESSFVAEYKGKVAGYLMGCKETKNKEKIFQQKILPSVFRHFIKKGLIFKKKTARFLFHAVKSLIQGEFVQPEIPAGYPAHLHINIGEDFRRLGIGTRLMKVFFEYLKNNNIKGVHLATFSDQGRDFFVTSGFRFFWERKSSQWAYLIGRDIKTTTFIKNI